MSTSIKETISSEEWRELIQLLPPKPLKIPTTGNPIISIIIPVYNKSIYTFKCLSRLADINNESLLFEVIVVDDCSIDDTQQMLTSIEGIRIVNNSQNLGFIESCNRGAKAAQGQYLVFLNNDTVPKANCFQELLKTYKLQPDAGLVGAKLLYPDGKLQEAGGIIWNDASGWNYGRLEDPNKPEYSYLREVDYCSGACIMVPKTIFEELGGFDTHYKPAYAEDSDLAFQIRQAGYKVFYQPLAEVIHFEGITSGTDVTSGVKKYQVINQGKFWQKWADVLKTHGTPEDNPYLEKERRVKKRILVIDACPLTPDQDAGSLKICNYIKIFQSLSYKVTFVPDNLLYFDDYTRDLQRIGVECLYWPYVKSIASHLKDYGKYYDIVFLSRPNIVEKHISCVRQYCPQARVVYDTADLHYIREQRQAAIENNPRLATKAMQTKVLELTAARNVDCTIVVSPVEQKILLAENPKLNVKVISAAHEVYGSKVPFQERKDILFIGGFQHIPNVDAVIYFTREIFPLIKNQESNIKFFIIGSKPPQEVMELASDDIIVTGYVQDLSYYFNQCRMSVVPLRYGAGIKGKIITSLSYGLPIVGTSLACEGMELEHGVNALITDQPLEFAKAVTHLHSDEKLWNKLSANGLEKMANCYSIEAAKTAFKDLFGGFENI